MLGENVMIVEDLSYIAHKTNIDDFRIMLVLLGVPMLLAGAYMIVIIFRWMQKMVDGLYDVDVQRTLYGTGTNDEKEDAIIRKLKEIRHYSLRKGWEVTIANIICACCSVMLGIFAIACWLELFLPGDYDGKIVHKYFVQVEGESMPLKVLDEYQILSRDEGGIYTIEEIRSEN